MEFRSRNNNKDSDTWQIDHQCPQCGAPVQLAEADRLLLCPFCRTKLCLTPGDCFRYCIPAPATAAQEIAYLPYWRLKGLSFALADQKIVHRFFDTNRLALDVKGLPLSLGLRPQACKLRFVSPEREGRFLDPVLSARAALQLLGATAPSGLPQVFIGEMISLIYAPVYLAGEVLYDGLLQSPLGALQQEDRERFLAPARPLDLQLRFIATLCPQCGGDLQGEREALVLICRNCSSAWTCGPTTLERVPISIMAAGRERAHCYLPFWRMRARLEGLDLNTCADLIRVANLPQAITGELEARPFYFWSPAFKINPALFLRWTRQMTVAQPAGEVVDTFPEAGLHPVTLPVSEAQEGIILTLASLLADKRRWPAILPHVRITLEEVILAYHPFSLSGGELVHAQMGVTINKNALAFGKQL